LLAALYRSPGSADVLSVEEVEAPSPGPGEVRVRLRVAGVNPTDGKSRSRATPDGFQVPGQDGAGDVVEVGPGVDPARVGERVWVWFAAANGRRWGTAAQETVVPSRQAVRLPDSASYDLGAGLGIPAMTAWHCLYADGPLSGRTVLVAGGGGAVGNAAVALARRGGARVVTTTSAAKAGLAEAAGAHVVLDRHAPDLAEQVRAAAPDGVHRVVEVALGANLALDLAVLAPHGVVSTYADDPLHDVPVRSLMVANATLAFVLIYGVADDDLDAAVTGVSAAVAAGDLPALPVVRHPLSEVGAAQDEVLAGAPGKVLLDLP
jgi:NADPH:quinone reductase-like Zn-dependent oxidoreductase